MQIVKSTDVMVTDENLWHRPAPAALHHFFTFFRLGIYRYFCIANTLAIKQSFGGGAKTTQGSFINYDSIKNDRLVFVFVQLNHAFREIAHRNMHVAQNMANLVL